MAGPFDPPVKGNAYTVFIALRSLATPGSFQANPTLASGDAKVSKDGGAFTNLTTLPAVTPAGGIAVQVDLSGTEMNADNVVIQFIDQTSPKEWADFALTIQTTAAVPLVQLADGVTHGGTTAKLRLGSSTATPAFYVTNSAVSGAAVHFQTTGTESIAFLLEGQNADSFGMSIVADAGVGLGIVGLNHGIYVEANQDVTLGGSGTITGQIFTATSLATFFTVNSGETYASSVAGSVVQEIADNADVSGVIDANVVQVNGVVVTGTGAVGDEWGPA